MPHVLWAHFCSRFQCLIEAHSAAWMFQDPGALCVDWLNGGQRPPSYVGGSRMVMRGPLFIAGFCVCLTIAAFESAVASPGRRCGGVSWRGPGSRTRLCGEGLGLSAPSVVCRGPRPVKKLRPHSPPRRPRLPEACAFCGQGSFSDVRSPPFAWPPPLQRRHLLGRVGRSCVHYRSEVGSSLGYRGHHSAVSALGFIRRGDGIWQ